MLEQLIGISRELCELDNLQIADLRQRGLDDQLVDMQELELKYTRIVRASIFLASAERIPKILEEIDQINVRFNPESGFFRLSYISNNQTLSCGNFY